MGEVKRKAKAKKDQGILTLPNGLIIREETRDQIKAANFDKDGPRNLAKNSPDDWTVADCQRLQFSGFRVSLVMNRMELWTLGVLRGSIPLDKCTPNTMATLHEEVFLTNGTVVAVPEEGDK